MTTINRNVFFGDQAHLEYLVQKALPELIRSFGYGIRKRLIVWSAGCSRGEEPYTLAMVLKEFAAGYPGLGFHFLVLATEDSSDLLDTAKSGIYEENCINPVPMSMRKKYLMRSKDRNQKLVRIAPELRELVKFRKTDPEEGNLFFREPIDIIFCRNAFHPGNKHEHEALLMDFYQHLTPGGYLFIGQSQDPADIHIPLVPVAPTIYRKLAH